MLVTARGNKVKTVTYVDIPITPQLHHRPHQRPKRVSDLKVEPVSLTKQELASENILLRIELLLELDDPRKPTLRLASYEQRHEYHLLWWVRHDAVRQEEPPEEDRRCRPDFVWHSEMIRRAQ